MYPEAVRAGILTRLLTAHYREDDRAFRKAALALAASESAAGHTRIAEEIRRLVAEMSAAPKRGGLLTDIVEPAGELAEILEGGHRSERWSDIILTEESRETLARVLRENRARANLERFKVEPRRHLLFFGPPGCGKTLAAAVLAGELGIPLLTVRLAALFSRFLGATANHLRAVFREMPRRPAVYLFDEFDAVAKARGDEQDVGEMRRIVTSFLQLMDADRSTSLVIAATNQAKLLDGAVFRRFDLHVEFPLPTPEQSRLMLELRLGRFTFPPYLISTLVAPSQGLSYAEIAIACDDAIRSMALDHRDALSEEDLERSLALVHSRHGAGGESLE